MGDIWGIFLHVKNSGMFSAKASPEIVNLGKRVMQALPVRIGRSHDGLSI